jgi:hypothetical protein
VGKIDPKKLLNEKSKSKIKNRNNQLNGEGIKAHKDPKRI